MGRCRRPILNGEIHDQQNKQTSYACCLVLSCDYLLMSLLFDNALARDASRLDANKTLGRAVPTYVGMHVHAFAEPTRRTGPRGRASYSPTCPLTFLGSVTTAAVESGGSIYLCVTDTKAWSNAASLYKNPDIHSLEHMWRS